MANSVYKVTEIIGTSTRSWEDAAKRAVQTAATSLRELRVAEVTALDMTVENGKVQAYRAKVKLSFKYEAVPTAAAPKKKAAKKQATKKKKSRRR
jgi:flavin-binding protein dodecin